MYATTCQVGVLGWVIAGDCVCTTSRSLRDLAASPFILAVQDRSAAHRANVFHLRRTRASRQERLDCGPGDAAGVVKFGNFNGEAATSCLRHGIPPRSPTASKQQVHAKSPVQCKWVDWRMRNGAITCSLRPGYTAIEPHCTGQLAPRIACRTQATLRCLRDVGG